MGLKVTYIGLRVRYLGLKPTNQALELTFRTLSSNFGQNKGENMRNLGVENAGGKTTSFFLAYEALESVKLSRA